MSVTIYPPATPPPPSDTMYPNARTPAAYTPRIIDPVLVKNIIQGIAYYADKLRLLHSEYRRWYEEQQRLNAIIQKEQSNMSHEEYQRIQSTHYDISVQLQGLIISIYEQFNKMKESLDRKHELQLDVNARSQFDRFQRYYEEFASSQHNLLVFAQQTVAQQQQYNAYHHQHVQQQQQQNASNYQIPPTPHDYRQRVENMYQNRNNRLQISDNANHQQYMQHVNSMTPRGQRPQMNGFSHSNGGHNGHQNRWRYNQQQQQQQNGHNGHNHRNTPQSTSAIPDRTFTWNKNAYNEYQQKTQNQQQKPQNMRMKSQTPRVNNGKNNVDIPDMAYVIIGSTMSALLPTIGIPEREVNAHSNRIKNALCNVLKKKLKNFDVVCYGSSTQKLFLKGMSDFDFCIRCNDDLNMSHNETMQYIANQLMDEKKNEFDNVKVIQSVHSNNLNNVHHISFHDRISRCCVDLCLNNLPEIGSSRFIAAYESIDPRFALLCRVVKYWGQQRKLKECALTSYALVLMVVNFLQYRRLLPTLSMMVDTKTGLSPWSTQDDYQINVQKYKDFAAKNEEPHSKLLVNFFKFYGHKFNYNTEVVSVRTGTYLRKDAQHKSDCFWVENPFNSKDNLCCNVSPMLLQRISNEFRRAYSILCESYKIYEVCKAD